MNDSAASLDRLHDIVMPPSAPWWPPAPGWYWLLGFVALGALALAIRGFVLWQHNRYRREALAELARLESEAADRQSRVHALAGISELLKRTALTAFPRPQVASLAGAEWLAFLDRTGGTTFSTTSGAALQAAVIDPRTAVGWTDQGVSEIVAMTRNWIRRHRRIESPAANK